MWTKTRFVFNLLGNSSTLTWGTFYCFLLTKTGENFGFALLRRPLTESQTCLQDETTAAKGEDRQASQGEQPVEDSLAILWDVVSALHDSGWHEDDMPRAILRLWKTSTIEPRLSNLSSLSLPEDFVTGDTIPVELTNMGPCEIASSPGLDVGTTRYEATHGLSLSCFSPRVASITSFQHTVSRAFNSQNVGVSGVSNVRCTPSPADRPDWSYALSITGERDLFDEDDGVGPASCCPELLPKKEVRGECMQYEAPPWLS